MPSECIANPLQRELADAIIRLQPLDEIRILLACGAKANEPVTQGLRPLHYAVWQRYTEAAQLLLVRGADIDATDECGYSALHLAAEHGYFDLVKLLLEHGAKVDHRRETGELFPRYFYALVFPFSLVFFPILRLASLPSFSFLPVSSPLPYFPRSFALCRATIAIAPVVNCVYSRCVDARLLSTRNESPRRPWNASQRSIHSLPCYGYLSRKIQLPLLAVYAR